MTPDRLADPYWRWMDLAVDAADDHAEGLGPPPRPPVAVHIPPPVREHYASDASFKSAVYKHRVQLRALERPT